MTSKSPTFRPTSKISGNPSAINSWASRLALMGVLLSLAGDGCQTDLPEVRADEAPKPSPSVEITPPPSSTGKRGIPIPEWKLSCLKTREKTEEVLRGKKNRQAIFYEPTPEYEKKMTPKEFKEAYENEIDKRRRYMLTLHQLVAGNAENEVYGMEVSGSDHASLKMKVISGLRVGGLTSQLDGPMAMAAATFLGGTLPTQWMVDQIYEQAKKNNAFTPFISSRDMATSLGLEWDKPDDDWMTSPEFALKREELLQERKKLGKLPKNAFTSGFFKDIVHPSKTTIPKKLVLYGGWDRDGRLAEKGPTGHHMGYSDATHGVTVVLNEVETDQRKMPLWEFYADPQYAEKFGFEPKCLAYPYITPFLWNFVDKHKSKDSVK